MSDAKPHPEVDEHPNAFAFLRGQVHSLVRGRLWLHVMIGIGTDGVDAPPSGID